MNKLLLGLVATSLLAIETIPFAGMAMHTKRFENVPTRADSPMGIFGIRATTNYFDAWINHISSIPNVGSETRGINLLGCTLKAPIGNTEPYIGYFYHNEEFDGKYYSEQFSEYQYRVGVRYHYDGDRTLFIDYLDSVDSSKADMLSYGFTWEFKDVM